MFHSKLIRVALGLALVGQVSSFSVSPCGVRATGLSERARGRKYRETTLVRMQERVEPLSSSDVPIPDLTQLDPAKQTPASGSQTTTRKAVPEINPYAKFALERGLLKPNSPLLRSKLVGNKGLDLFNWASDEGLLLQYREAELKHARLAMLASVGWAVSELVHPAISRLLGWTNFLQLSSSGALSKAPSVLNGGLDKVSPVFWGAIVFFTSALEVARMLTIAENPNRFTPGALGFDPLQFYAQADDAERRQLQLKEVNNGRLAMLGISAMVVKEWLFNDAIVNLSPEYFTNGPLANIGSLVGLLGQYGGLLSCTSGIVYCGDGQDAIGSIMQQDGGASAEYIQDVLGSLFL